jgi:hypothetical protein
MVYAAFVGSLPIVDCAWAPANWVEMLGAVCSLACVANVANKSVSANRRRM